MGNGLLFETLDINSMFNKIKLLRNAEFRKMLSSNAIHTMQEVWNPQVAAERIIRLSERLLAGLDTDYIDGPLFKSISIQKIRYESTLDYILGHMD